MNRVLVIDDEKDVCEYLAMVLRDEDFTVEYVLEPKGVREAIQRFEPAVLLIDYRMPGQTGAELVREIRREPQWRDLALIMVTALAGEEEKVSALDMGADDYVVKPFSPKELAARIRAVLRRRSELKGTMRLEAGDLVVDLNKRRRNLSHLDRISDIDGIDAQPGAGPFPRPFAGDGPGQFVSDGSDH